MRHAVRHAVDARLQRPVHRRRLVAALDGPPRFPVYPSKECLQWRSRPHVGGWIKPFGQALRQAQDGLSADLRITGARWQVGGGEWLVTRVGVGLGGVVGRTGAGDGGGWQ